ncbi:MAG: sigma 54-interacting transcriptional regulator, partial [Candidatus Polarisedimenticolia bacterium]
AHSRVRQAIYEGLPESRRRELHAAAGLAIEAVHGPAAADVVDELAHHFAAAGDAPRAADYAWRAGVRAIDLFDYGRAVGHLTKVLEFLPPEATTRRLEALGRLTFIHAWPVGDPEKCLANARRLQEEARRAGSELHEAKALSFQGWAQSSLGQEEAALESGRRGLALVRRSGGPAEVCSGLNLLGLIYARRGDNRQAKVHFEEALALGEAMDDRPQMTVILGNLVLNAIGLGEGEAAIPMVKRLLTFCSDLGLEYDYNRFLVSHGIIQEEMGNLEAAIEASRQAAAWARERANAAILIGALNNLGLYSWSQGLLDRALRRFEEEKSHRQEGGDLTGILACLDSLGRVQLDLGRVERAAAIHREGLEKARAAGTRMQEGFLLAALAADRLAAGAWDEAALHARDALAIGRELDHARITCYALCAQALLAARRGDRKEAAAAVRLLTRVETKRVRFIDRLRMNLTLGRVALLAGKPDEALREARAGIAATERNGYREFHWRFRALAGDAWSAKGLDEDALASYNAARSVIRDIATGIEDKDVRDDYLNEDGRRDLLRRERGPVALPPVAESPVAEAPAASDDAVRLLSSIYEITQVINSILDLKELLNKVMDLAIDSVRAERGLVFLYRSETDEMEMVVARNMEHQTIRDATEYSRSILREAGRGQSILSVDAVTDDRFRQYRSVLAYKIRSLLCVPLRMRDRIIGTVYVDTRRPGTVFAEQDRRFLEAFANQAAIAIENARLYDQVRQENRQLKAAVQERYGFENIIGRSARMREVFALLSRISGSGMRVMIRGESGTGKELIARAIHHNSPRRDRRYFTENCAALTDTLLESELFGHVKGAFTGADSSRKGLFEMADGGTLFLDEVGDMSLAMQSKLLRVLEHGEIRPVGAETSRHVDVRVISATNRDLEAMIRKKQFREDLYYRMNGVTVNLPALRERRDDIPLIIDHFLTRMARENGTPKLRVDPALMALLARYDWPGNVRELENQVSKLALFAAGDTVTRDSASHDPAFFQRISTSGRGVETNVTADDLRRALQEAGGNRDRAATLLGISRATLFRKLKEHRVSDRPQPPGRPPQV